MRATEQGLCVMCDMCGQGVAYASGLVGRPQQVGTHRKPLFQGAPSCTPKVRNPARLWSSCAGQVSGCCLPAARSQDVKP